MMQLISAMDLQAEKTLDTETNTVATLRAGAAKARPHASESPALAAYLAKVDAWSAAEDAVLAAETKARADVIVPLCDAHTNLENLQADLAREKTNPSGVVDLAELHKIGRMIQVAQGQIAELNPQYAAVRKHPYAGWASEGACVAAYESR